METSDSHALRTSSLPTKTELAEFAKTPIVAPGRCDPRGSLLPRVTLHSLASNKRVKKIQRRPRDPCPSVFLVGNGQALFSQLAATSWRIDQFRNRTRQ